MLRGAQLTVVGGMASLHLRCKQGRLINCEAHRALLNPGLFKHEHYKQALWAVAAGIIINVIIEIPVSHQTRTEEIHYGC